MADRDGIRHRVIRASLLAVMLALVALAVIAAASCSPRGQRNERDGNDDLWHEVEYETTRAV